MIPILISLGIPLLVKLVDKIFPPKTGPSKLSTVAALVQAITAALASLGTPGSPIDLATITAAVQKAVDELNAAGELKGADTVVVPVTGVPPAFAPAIAERMLTVLEGIAGSLGVKP